MSSDYRPRLVADQSLPYLAGLLDAVADVTYLPSQEISRERLIEEKAEGLLIRSVTRCNQSLLEGTLGKYPHYPVSYGSGIAARGVVPQDTMGGAVISINMVKSGCGGRYGANHSALK